MEDYQGHCNPAGPEGSLPQTNPFHTLSSLYASHPSSYIRDDRSSSSMNQYSDLDRPDWSSGAPEHVDFDQAAVTFTLENKFYSQLVGYGSYRLKNGGDEMNITANPVYEQIRIRNGAPDYMYQAVNYYDLNSSGHKLNGDLVRNGHQLGVINGKCLGRLENEPTFESPNVRPGTISKENGCSGCIDSVVCGRGSLVTEDSEINTRPDVSAVGADENELRGGGRDGEREMQRNGDYIKSVWINCRLPLLILLFSILLVLFFIFSGALIYLKYASSPSRSVQYGTSANPCDAIACSFGAICVMENGGSRAVCRCPTDCPSQRDPVCGSDDLTYTNECLLRMFACQHKKYVRVRHAGECHTPDPCAKKKCHYGAKCIPAIDGLYAICECPKSCSDSGSSSRKEGLGPVCGSDGKVYRNRCELEKEACRLRRNITLKYYGKCDPCDDVVCSPPQVCQLDPERRPTCHCGEVCRTELDQVCASDGKTYANECMMRQEACHTRQNLRIIFHGKCSSGVNPCESRTCPGYETCAINRFGIAQCVCTMKCEPILRPVCGSDGKTYDNYCELTFAGCHQARHIDMSYRGTCDAASACARHKCPLEATCVEKNGEITCECPTCPSDYDPVCGSDGVSYQNECRLRLEACLTNSDVRKMYRGLCNLIRDFNPNDGCDRMQCDFYSICDGTSGTVKCVCPQNCEEGSGPAVCGTDGVTYQSECELQKSACEQQKFVVLASTGPCDLCRKVECKFGAECEKGSCVCPVECPLVNEPVCGSDLMSYDSECELEKAACQLSRLLTVLFYGRCTDALSNLHTALGPALVSSGVDGRKPVGRNNSMKSDPNSLRTSLFSPTSSSSSKDPHDYNGGCASIQCEFGAVCELTRGTFPRCTCQLDCSSHVPSASPVCGSDLKLYPSECEMRRESCQEQKELRPRPLELCEDDNDDRMATKSPPCLGTINGCCPDGITAALGPKFWGCPSTSYYSGSLCDCNKFGSVNDDCDFFTQKCHCRHGVAGSKCDRCSPGFWGFAHSHQVCKECGCSRFGSLHQDCEQMTGKCACKAGVRGHKCDSCDLGEYLGPDGCTSDPIRLGRSCDQILCNYGAECVQDVDRAGCACKMKCADVKDNQVKIVCASNGMTYASECFMKRQACTTQQLLYRIHSGPCPSKSELSETNTMSSVGRWTGRSHNKIGPGDDGTGSGESFQDKRTTTHLFFGSSVFKSTRHLPREQPTKQTGELDRYADTTPASVPFQERIYLGDVCERSADCRTAQSICHDGRCVCPEGFLEDAQRIQCKSIHAHSIGVLTCTGSISSCPHPAYCFDYGNGTSTCICPLGKLNPKQGCHDRGQLHPFFNGRSSMKIEKLAGYHKLSLELEITPYTSSHDGILIFSSQHANGSGDFLSLVLVDGFVELRYDLGDGPAILRSASRLHSGTNYHIVAKRYNRDGLLRVDGEEDVKGSSPGTMKSLNLDQGFMGWVPLNSSKVRELLGTSEGFVGCIHSMRVGRRSIHFSQDDPLINSINQVGQCPFLSAFNPPSSITPISFFDEHPAEEEEEEGPEWAEGEDDFIVNQIPPSVSFTSISHDNQEVYYKLPGLGSKLNPCSIRYPCQNHGLCWEDLGSPRRYKCVCHPDFMGDHCETRSRMREESGVMLDFQGLSYLELPRMENAGRKVSIEIWFMTRAKNGIILYNGQEIGKGDFITLLLMNGHVQYIFELGSGMANITWRHQISLNEWHWVVATRDGREGTLQVDGQAPIIGKSPPTLSELNLELPLYVGGVRDFNVIHRELEIFTPFDGVLQYLKVNGETHHREITLSLRQRLVHPYEGAPCSSALSPNCLNGGSCFPRLGSFHCVCSPDFIGESCEKSIQTPRPVRFDGLHFIQWPPSPFKQRDPIKDFLIDYAEYDDPSELQFDTPVGPSFVAWNENDGSSDVESMLEEKLPQDSNSPSESERGRANGSNRIEIVFRTTSEDSGVIMWTGMSLSRRPNRKPSEGRSTEGYMGLFLADGHVELRLELDAAGNIEEPTTVIRSKVKVNDGRWHKVVVARQWRLLLLQVGGAIPQRATVPADGDNVIISDGRYWIGGVEPSVLPVGVPTSLQGFKGCVDLVRIEKQRLPLFKIAYSSGLPFCDDD